VSYDIDAERVLALVSAVRGRTSELETVRAGIRTQLDQLDSLLASGLVFQTSRPYADGVLMPDLQALAQRIANVLGGTEAAAAAYVAGDERMAETAARSAASVERPAYPGFRADRFRPQVVD
jgi:Family of unknown function (DUF6507)